MTTELSLAKTDFLIGSFFFSLAEITPESAALCSIHRIVTAPRIKRALAEGAFCGSFSPARGRLEKVHISSIHVFEPAHHSIADHPIDGFHGHGPFLRPSPRRIPNPLYEKKLFGAAKLNWKLGLTGEFYSRRSM